MDDRTGADLQRTRVTWGGPRRAAPTADLPPHEERMLDAIGRYVVTGRLGAGGMGSVWLAIDPQLGREVAIKRISGRKNFRERFTREATLLAALSHPNVVTIYEVGEHEGEPFLAMERVAGPTLELWLRQPRTWQEIVAVMLQAGRGLAAAHERGIVHRDFKPANVIVGEDGRARVVDFGLAALHDDQTDSEGESSPTGPDSSPSLTQTGTVMGTPAYMAPEQFTGKNVGAAADQFAFCIVLYEALHEERPFRGESFEELAVARHKGPPKSPVSSRVPAWLHALVIRGLQPAPADRWPSMSALLEALEQGATRRRRWMLPAIAGVAASTAALAFSLRPSAQEQSPCAGGEERVAEVWGDPQHDAIATAFDGLSAPYAAHERDRTVTALDTYGARWAEGRLAACEATWVHHEQSSEALDLRMACLERARQALNTTITVLSDVDDEMLLRAHRLTAALPDLDPCDDVEGLRARQDPTKGAHNRELVSRLLAKLQRIRTLRDAGRLQVALDELDATQPEIDAADHPPLHSEASLSRGQLLFDMMKLDEAEPTLTAAFTEALDTANYAGASRAAATLAQIYDEHLFIEPKRAQWLAETSLALARGADKDDVELVLDAMAAVATAASANGNLQESLDRAAEVVAQAEEAFGPDDLRNVPYLVTQGSVLLNVGHAEEALPAWKRVVDLTEKGSGPDHPSTGGALVNYGQVLASTGKPEEALPIQQRGLAILEAAYGPDHPATIGALNNVAITQQMLGHDERALSTVREVERRMEAKFGHTHGQTQIAHRAVAHVLMEQGRIDEGLAILEEMLEFPEIAGEPRVLPVELRSYGQLLADKGRLEEADEVFTRSLALFEALAEDNGNAMSVRSALGKVAMKRGDYERARPLLESAYAETRGGDPGDAALSAWYLAELLGHFPEDLPRARELATEARHDMPEGMADRLPPIDAWLADHPAP